MATIKKKFNVMDITVVTNKGKTQILHTAPGEKIRNIKQYVYKVTEGNAVYQSHTQQEVTYEMELKDFLKYATISNGENETNNEQEVNEA